MSAPRVIGGPVSLTAAPSSHRHGRSRSKSRSRSRSKKH
jgi:hypothetical protein